MSDNFMVFVILARFAREKEHKFHLDYINTEMNETQISAIVGKAFMAAHLRLADENPSPTSIALPGKYFGHLFPINTKNGDKKILIIGIDEKLWTQLNKVMILDSISEILFNIQKSVEKNEIPRNSLGKLWETISWEITRVTKGKDPAEDYFSTL